MADRIEEILRAAIEKHSISGIRSIHTVFNSSIPSIAKEVRMGLAGAPVAPRQSIAEEIAGPDKARPLADCPPRGAE